MTGRIPTGIAYVDDEDSGGVWILRLEDSRVQGLSATAGLIWKACDGAPDVAAVVSRLCAENDWDPTVVRGDIQKFVADLEGRGLIENLVHNDTA